jgi:HK97 family phage portal protein
MKLFNFFKKEAPQSNEDLRLLNYMLYQYINRDLAVPTWDNKTSYIRLGYAYNPTVYSAISLRSYGAKSIPWLVYKVKDKKKHRAYTGITTKAHERDLKAALQLKEQSLEEITNHEINRLIDAPNSHQTFQDLIESAFVNRDVTGDAFLYTVLNPVTKKVIELHSLPSDKTDIIAGTFLNPVKGYKIGQLGNDMIEPDRIIHWKYYNPIYSTDGKQLYGMSPLLAAARIINMDNMGIDAMTAAFLNEGVKSILTGTQQTEIPFTQEQMKAIIDNIKKATERAKKGGGNIMANRAPMEILKIGETPVDLGILESRKYNKETIANIYRIHPSLLSSDASTLNNFGEARKALMTNSVLPDLDSFRDHLNKMISLRFGAEYYVDYDLMAINELRDDVEKIARTMAVMDWTTKNEKREATDYDAYPHPGADILYTDMSKIPLGGGVDSDYDKIDAEIEKIRKNGLANHRP